MKVVVQKYGGSSVATVDKLRKVAEKIVATRRAGNEVVAVVSAMGDTTDDLLRLARQVAPEPSKRELDMLLSVGERISMALLSIAIHELGEKAISLTGSQCGIITNDTHANARIMDVRPFRVEDELERGHIVIVAGYQGTSYKREVTTLGRGGSDTTAVALAAALGAEHCDIYSDVDGIFTSDPRVVTDARKLDTIGYEEMQEMARQGARVLNAQAVEFARRHQVAIYARSTHTGGEGTAIRRIDGVLDEQQRVLDAFGARGVAGRKDLVLVAYENSGSGEDRTDDVLGALGDTEVLHAGSFPGSNRLDVLLGMENVADPEALAARVRQDFEATVTVTSGLGSAAAVGLGIGERPGALLRAHAAVREAGARIEMSYATRTAVACVVAAEHVDDSVRALHKAFVAG